MTLSFEHEKAEARPVVNSGVRAYVSLGVLLLAALPVMAAAPPEVRLEITPFAGYQLGGEFDLDPNTGTSEDLEIRDAGNYGIFVSALIGKKGAAVGGLYVRQDTELDSDPVAGLGETDLRVEYFHIEGRYSFPKGTAHPFVSASFGVTRYEAAGFDNDSRLSGSIAGGVVLHPSKHFGFRFEGRYYGTLFEQDDVEVCDDAGLCFTYEESTVQSQYDVKGGIVITF